MDHYTFNIIDYASTTRHLSLYEDLAYRRMLDLYYTREGPLPERVEDVARLISMRGYTEEVEAVLRDFFMLLEGTGWVHEKCDEELWRRRNLSAKRKKASLSRFKDRAVSNPEP